MPTPFFLNPIILTNYTTDEHSVLGTERGIGHRAFDDVRVLPPGVLLPTTPLMNILKGSKTNA